MPGIPIRVDSLDYMLQKIQIVSSLETICNYQYSQTCLQRPRDPKKCPLYRGGCQKKNQDVLF
jgi:hypothetical protein